MTDTLSAALKVPNVDELDTLAAALAYARHGWYVGPVKAGTKHPGSILGGRWQAKTSREPEVIVSWFAGTDHGVFLHAGRSGALVIDVDTPSKLHPDIARAVRELEVPFQLTRPGEWDRGHYVFAQPPGRNFGNGLGKLAGGWGEIRGLNGVILAEPSAHPEGGEYVWETCGPVPELPDYLAEQLDDAVEAAETATDAQVVAFLGQYRENSHPEYLDVRARSFLNKAKAGESRHESMVGAMVGVMKDAHAGTLDAQLAHDTLESLFLPAVAEPGIGKQGKARTPATARSEWAGIRSWAIAQALASDPAEVRAQSAEKVPDVSTLIAPTPSPVLGEDAYQGLPGRVVGAIRPHTEAADAALLLTFLAAAGSLIDADAYLFAGDAQHAARIWPLIIGKTAGGMKGTSANPILRLLKLAYPEFSMNIESGLSTGEGLIERVRDHTGEPDDKDFDEGVQDKRLLVIETEFGVVLGRARREGNVLSETLRAAWDGKTLSTMTRKSTKLRATGAHIVIVGHITPTELRAKLTESDVAGGLMNRFLPVHSHRSKRKPDGGSTPEAVLKELADELADAITAAWKVRRVERDADAAQLWRDVYADLTPDDLPDGAYASVIARAAAQVVRISLIYALLDTHDGPVQIRTEHLKAALGVWKYVQESAAAVFGDLSAGGALNKLTEAIDAAGDAGLTRWQVADLFGRHKSKGELDELIRRLLATGRYVATEDKTGPGRATTRYLRREVSEESEERRTD